LPSAGPARVIRVSGLARVRARSRCGRLTRLRLSHTPLRVEDYQTVVLASGGAIALIVVSAIVVAVFRRRRRARAMQAPLPLIPFSAGHGAGFGPPRPDRAFRAPAPPAPFDHTTAPTPAWSPPVRDGIARPHQGSPYAPPPQGPLDGNPRTGAPNTSAAVTPQPNDTVAGAAVEGLSMR